MPLCPPIPCLPLTFSSYGHQDSPTFLRHITQGNQKLLHPHAVTLQSAWHGFLAVSRFQSEPHAYCVGPKSVSTLYRWSPLCPNFDKHNLPLLHGLFRLRRPHPFNLHGSLVNAHTMTLSYIVMILPLLPFLQSHSLRSPHQHRRRRRRHQRYLPNAFFLSMPSLLAFHLMPFHRINLTGMEWSQKQMGFSG